MKPNEFPPGWDEERVQSVIAHYEQQTEDEVVAEDEAAFQDPSAVGFCSVNFQFAHAVP